MTAIKPFPHRGGHLVSSPIPASLDDDGLMMSEWELTNEDREKLLCGGSLRVWVYTPGIPLPVMLEALEPTDGGVVRES